MPASSGLFMRATVKIQGFSLLETLFALMLLSLTATGLMTGQKTLIQGLRLQSQMLSLWRLLEQQSDIAPLPVGKVPVTRHETSQAGCVSITVSLPENQGHSGTLYRYHCPVMLPGNTRMLHPVQRGTTR